MMTMHYYMVMISMMMTTNFMLTSSTSEFPNPEPVNGMSWEDCSNVVAALKSEGNGTQDTTCMSCGILPDTYTFGECPGKCQGQCCLKITSFKPIVDMINIFK